MKRRGASTLVELLVVIGVIAILIAIALPVIHRTRQHSARTKCASNLRQLGAAFATYATENRGFVPRYSEGYFDSAGPIWIPAIVPYAGGKKDWQWADLPKSSVFQCPSHPTENLPSAFVVNCFAFESAPQWTGAPSTPAGRVRNSSQLPWLLETPDLFNTSVQTTGFFDDIFFEPFHILRSPDHLTGGATPRINETRHVSSTSNVLFFDGHVAVIHKGDLRLEMLDDGIRSR